MFGLHAVTALTIAGAFGFGLVLALLGSVKLALAKRLTLSEDRVGALVAALNLALIPMMLISGLLIDKLGVRGVFLAGSLVTATAVFLLGISETYHQALGAIVLVGAGGACLSTGSSVLMTRAFFPDSLSASQNMGNVFFGIGALLAPLLADGLIRRLEFRRALGLLAIVYLAPALLAAVTPHEAFDLPEQAGDLAAVFNDPVLWLAGLIFWLYGPLEGSIGTWATTYLTDLGIRERRAALFLSGFWLTFLAARLAAALLQERGLLARNTSDPWLIVVLALASGVILGNMAGAHRGMRGALGLLLVGAAFGPIFPTLVGFLFSHFKTNRGTAFGAMFAVGATGNLIIPPVIGAWARKRSVRRAMHLPMMLAILMALVATLVALGWNQ